MSERAYTLLEALGQLVYEMEGVIDQCNADEPFAVTDTVCELGLYFNQGQKLLRSYSPGEDDDGDQF